MNPTSGSAQQTPPSAPRIAQAKGQAGPTAADRRTLRRAVRAGVATATALALLGLIANAAFGGDGLSAGVWVASAVVVGLLMASGWLVLALLLDLIAGHVPGQRRVIWTAVLFAVAFVSPVLPAAMLQVAARQ